MSSEYVIDIFEMWRIILRRRWLVLGAVAVAIAGAALATILAPAVYRCHSTIAIPGDPYQWIRIPEVREVVAAARERALRGQPVGGITAGEMAMVHDVRVSDIPESRTFFKLVVKAKGNPKLADRVSRGIYGYLTTAPEVQTRLRAITMATDSALAFAEQAFQAELKRRDRPASAEGLVAIYDKVVEYRLKKAGLRNFEYISEPITDPRPISPRPALNVAIAALIGLMAGLALAAAAERGR
jgi:LPS O-antigen subunit length determinant protein (WzzB/FepE family)